MENTETTYTAFAGPRMVVSGDLKTMLREVKTRFDGDESNILIFEDRTGRQVDFDFQGAWEEVWERACPDAPKQAGPGRPKLGVVCREVSLLPRHWEWLEGQPSGASAALRRLIDEARKRDPDKERARLATEAASRFMTAVAGNYAGFEEASRALYARDRERLAEQIREWPKDIRSHIQRLAQGVTPVD